jgi:tRNA (guanine-N7-)-methyltransferase
MQRQCAMAGNSPQIVSPQSGTHPRLAEVVLRHRDHAWRAPLHGPTMTQFARWQAQRETSARPLLVDLGCGHGDSTLLLAARHPQAELLGIDQSAHRLARLAPDGFAVHVAGTLVRAEAATWMRALAEAGIAVDTLFLLYPNPWPKSEHLMRRWHGHPVFPLLLAARRVVLRTTWPIYADEFAVAAALLGRPAQVRALGDADAVLTPFERKYRESGHARFELVIGDA